VLDGLRGLAVVAVVLFHFAPDQVPGGFLGVDVFFVLSGFLLTSLVLVEHHNNSRISLSGFWNRRIRRLLPAALATVVVSVGIAFIVEPDYTRSALRGEALAAITYVANWWTIGHGQSYASSFGPQSPVAHFWSLAVEEQFYLLFPFLILGLVSLIAVATRRNLARPELQRLSIALLIVAVLGTLASAIAMVVIHTPGTDPSREYLGTDTRVQTILVGVALACIWYLVPRRPDSEMRKFAVPAGTALLAALLLAIAFTDFRSDWLYQGGFTIIAIGIAALIWILARHGSATTNHVLESGPMRRLGEVSYGLYLWHWPLLCFPAVLGIPMSQELRVIILTASVVLASLTHELVDRRAQKGAHQRGLPLSALAWLAALALCGWLSSHHQVSWLKVKPAPASALKVVSLRCDDHFTWTSFIAPPNR